MMLKNKDITGGGGGGHQTNKGISNNSCNPDQLVCDSASS